MNNDLIVCDMDGVLVDVNTPYNSMIYDRFKIKMKRDDYTQYNTHKILLDMGYCDEIADAAVKLYESDIYDTTHGFGQLVGSGYILDELRKAKADGFRVMLYTKSSSELMTKRKEEYIGENKWDAIFDEIRIEGVYDEDVTKSRKDILGRLIIEDYLDNATSFIDYNHLNGNTDVRALIISQPYNRETPRIRPYHIVDPFTQDECAIRQTIKNSIYN